MKPNISHETESKTKTNEGFLKNTETESFEVKDSKLKLNPKPIRNLEKSYYEGKKSSIKNNNIFNVRFRDLLNFIKVLD